MGAKRGEPRSKKCVGGGAFYEALPRSRMVNPTSGVPLVYPAADSSPIPRN